MPAAALRDRRVKVRSRATGPADRARPRPPSPLPAGASKVRAARGVGLAAPLAAGAAAVIALLVVLAVVATGGRGRAILAGLQARAERLSAVAWTWTAGLQDHFADLGFRVADVRLQGATPVAQAEIAQAVGVRRGTPILRVDLEALRERVERVGWVEKASVVRLLPDTLVVAVKQRPLIAIWEHAGRRVVVASNGAVVGAVRPEQFRGLPVVVGEGANIGAPLIMPQLSSRPWLWSRLRAVTRVDDRRWDLDLLDGGVVLLPAAGETDALNRLGRLEKASRILELGLARIDLRDPEMVIVRPRGPAAAAPVAVTHGA